jgi:hypothetical protein
MKKRGRVFFFVNQEEGLAFIHNPPCGSAVFRSSTHQEACSRGDCRSLAA